MFLSFPHQAAVVSGKEVGLFVVTESMIKIRCVKLFSLRCSCFGKGGGAICGGRIHDQDQVCFTFRFPGQDAGEAGTLADEDVFSRATLQAANRSVFQSQFFFFLFLQDLCLQW